MATIGKSKMTCDTCLYGTLYDEGCVVCKECEHNPKVDYWEEVDETPFDSLVDQTNADVLRKRGLIK